MSLEQSCTNILGRSSAKALQSIFHFIVHFILICNSFPYPCSFFILFEIPFGFYSELLKLFLGMVQATRLWSNHVKTRKSVSIHFPFHCSFHFDLQFNSVPFFVVHFICKSIWFLF